MVLLSGRSGITIPSLTGQSPSSKVSNSSACEAIPRRLWDLKFRYPPLDPILSQVKPFHAFPSCFSKIHFKSVFPFTPRSSEWLFPPVFLTKIHYAFLLNLIRVTCPAHPTLLELISPTLISVEENKSKALCILLLFRPSQAQMSPAAPTSHRPSTHSFNVTDQVSHTYSGVPRNFFGWGGFNKFS